MRPREIRHANAAGDNGGKGEDVKGNSMIAHSDTTRTPAPGLGAWSDPYMAGQLRWLVGTLAALADDLAARGDHHAARDTRRLLAAARRLRRTLTGEEGRDAA